MIESNLNNSLDEYIEEINLPLMLNISKRLKDFSKKIKIDINRNDLRSKIISYIKKIKSKNLKLKVISIDSSFSNPPLEILGGYFILYSYGYISNFGIKDVFGNITITNKIEDISKYLLKKERKLAIKLMKKKKNGDLEFDMILLDGPINNFPGEPFKFPNSIIKDLIEELLHLAKKTKTIIVGFPKRVKSVILSSLLQLNKPISDKILSNIILEKGEYIKLGKLRNILEPYYKYLVKVKNIKINNPLEAVEKVREYGNVEVVLYKTSIGNKVEIYNPTEISLDDIVAYLYYLSAEGLAEFPYLLDKVDELVRITTFDTYSIYISLIKNVDSKTYEGILKHANPQKLYLFRKTKKK